MQADGITKKEHIIQKEDKMTQPILQFIHEHAFLSNFYPSEFVWDNIVWPNAESAYQAAKTHDRNTRLWMSKIKSPAEVKKEGRALPCRPDWKDVKYSIMYNIVREKFRQNPDLRAKLIATGDSIIEEGNDHHDKTWGICPPGSGEGLNWLGEILMLVREEVKSE